MKNIHPTAIIAKGVQIGKNVTIEPYVVIDSCHVILEDNVIIKSHVFISGHTTVGQGSVIWPFASIGADTQDLKFKGETTFVKIGKSVSIREYVTINGSCGEGTEVFVGDNSLIMAYCHIAHNCTVGKGVVMANGATLAGHVNIGDYAILGGSSLFHQFVQVGAHAMVGGASRVLHDFPPFVIGGGEPLKLGGLNRVGLLRHGFSKNDKQALTKAYRLTFRSGLPLAEALMQIQGSVGSNQRVKEWLKFCRQTKRGLCFCHKNVADSMEKICN